ncbi:hypothetical protein MKX01_037040 [Papaver californicum]|nr:hypothetical protein MKX01_037040 [Papaver californicum]
MASQMAILFKKEFAKCDCVYTPRQLIEEIRRDYGIDIIYKQAYAGCKRGIEAVRGSPDESYKYLVGYSHMLELYNPGTITAIKTDANDAFLYYFFALGVCLDGFKSKCRSVFSVDSTHITNCDSCEWFMQKLFDVFGSEYSSREDLVVCLDRSQNNEEVVTKVFPRVCHVYCAYHLKVNIIKKFHNVAAAEAFMRDAKAYTDKDYRKAMSGVKKDKLVLTYVWEVLSRFWARIHAKSHRFTLMTTNISDTCNAPLLKDRNLPITHLVDFLRS